MVKPIFGIKILKATLSTLLGIVLGILFLYGCDGGGGGGSGDGSVPETNSATTIVATMTGGCLSQTLNISYDPGTPAPDTTIALQCPADKIALVVMGANGAPTSKTYHLPQAQPGRFRIPKSVWDAALEGAPAGSYDITLLVYNADNVTSIPKAGAVNVLNDYPAKD